MELSTTVFCFFVSFLFIVLFKKSFFSSSKGKELPLPPGSMGWPYIGETFQMYSQDPSLFFANKIKRFNSNPSFLIFFLLFYEALYKYGHQTRY